MRRAALVLAALLVLAAALGGHARAAALAGPWCGGSDEVVADRQPDAVSGQQIHVVYAVPTDRPDRFATLAPLIVDDLAAGDRWWRGQDATRTLRFDLFAFPGCGSSMGDLDISVVHLPHDSAYYDVSQPDQSMRLGLDLAPIGSDPYKKYLVYFDGAATQIPDVCGYSPRLADSGGLAARSTILLQQGEGCGTLGAGGYTAVVAIHELTHNLGAVPSGGPPHACPGDDAHVCDDPRDLMEPNGRSDFLGDYVLDAGRDDYYGHSGSWWDVQDSPWLVHLDAPQYPLTVHVVGSAAGSVASDLPGLVCSASCTVDWQAGTPLSLTATPTDATTATFSGWSGACTGTDTCPLTIDGPKDVTVRFDQLVTLSLRVVGVGGTVTASTGEACDGGVCSISAAKDTVVDLVARPNAGSRFVGWTGACAGVGRCSVLADAAKSVGAVFAPATARQTVVVHGRGSVTSTPKGIACPGRCAASFRFGQQVRLVAHPAKGYRFVVWSGGCKGPGRCLVAIGASKPVSALFVRLER